MALSRDEVNSLYGEVLGRAGDDNGLGYYSGSDYWTADRIRQDMMGSAEYANRQSNLSQSTATQDSSASSTPVSSTPQIVPGQADPNNPNQINIVDYAGQVAMDPSLAVNGQTSVVSQTANQTPDVNAGLINGNDPKYQMNSTPTVSATTVDSVTPKTSATYDVATTEDKVAQNQMTAATGQLSEGAIISDNEIAQNDIQGLATGVNADGTTNYTGQALNKFASIDLTNVIDTSTAAGKALAEQLGTNGYVDSKATLKGQLDILQSEFQDANGNPKIPVWAQGTARNVSKIAAFSGMTGTAATAAMATALMEASVSVAQSDAQFFQTLTLQNLTNEQQSVINTANVLAKMEEQNTDNRMAAAIQNSKNFLEMDLKNLDNEQQTRVINNQARIQSILEDAKAENTKRMFVAESTNEMNKFYDQLNSQIKQFNASQTLEADKFNATMEDSREKFYKEMQYNIDVSNAKWRQTVELNEDQQAFEAATTDVKNMLDISTSQLNQIWDRSDALLDYIWKSSENQKDRDNQLALNQLTAKTASKNANMTAIGQLAGTFIGSDAGQGIISSIFDGLF